MEEKKIPKDRNGTPLSPGDFVGVYLDHSERPDHLAKVVVPGADKSVIRIEGRRECESQPVDNQKLEVF